MLSHTHIHINSYKLHKVKGKLGDSWLLTLTFLGGFLLLFLFASLQDHLLEYNGSGFNCILQLLLPQCAGVRGILMKEPKRNH